ncbi:hypothetical protein BJ912DRAFT_929458 [Pholiota molesta]|nr:hypothetical protein BJ912DRAFT_929458 [Pholiota molesta]
MWSQGHKLSTKQKIQRVGKKYVGGVVAAFRAPKVEPPPASPIPHLLLSNIPPSDAEAAVVRGVIDKAREEYTRILSADAENQGSESWTENNQRERIADFIDQHQRILSSIRCLPPEILQHIFLYFADNPRSYGLDIDPRWAIGQVCHSWRASALSLSSLWSKLPSLYMNGSKKYKETRLNFFREFLRRSRGAPLNVSVIEFGWPGTYDGSTHPILTLLLSHCERWEYLSMDVSVPTLLGLQGIKGRLPLLQILSLDIDARDSANDFPPSLVDIFRVAPRLQEVIIAGNSATTELALPFSQLIRYETASRTVSFDDYPQLQVFAATSRRELNRIFQSVPTRPIVMSFTKFILRASLSEHHSMELRSIRLPFIEEICIESDTPTLCRDLTFILFRSTMESCMLTRLELRTQYHDRMDLLALLEVTPALVHLEAKISFYGIIVELASTEGNKVFVPLLEYCSFLICADDLDDNMRLAVALFARWRCERADGVGVRRVRALEVHDFDAWGRSISDNRELCLKQTDFEIWRVGSKDAFINELNDLEAFKAALIQEVGPYSFHQGKKGKTWSDTPKTRRVEKILTEIEAYKINDILTLIRSELHFYLANAFSLCPSPSKESRGPIHEHARRIIQNWTHTVVPILHNIRWVFMRRSFSNHYLTYIRSEHCIRSFPDANASLLMYGSCEYSLLAEFY